MRDRTLWLVQIAAAGVVLGLLALHMGIMHLDASLGVLNPADAPPVAWDNLVARGRGFGVLAGYLVLLGAALVHGLLGLRGILLELSPAPRVRRAQAAVLSGLGLGLFLLGTWAAWTAFRLDYFAELDAGGEEVKAALFTLDAAARAGPVTLLYAAKSEERNNAVALREWLERR